MQVFIGIEGGASVSKSVLVRNDGVILAEAVGSSLNYLLDGIDTVFERIRDHLRELREKSSADRTPLEIVSIGMCLSGCEDEVANQKLAQEFQKKNPGVCGNVTVASDVVGSIRTVTPDGGLVLISGTGSNCFLLNPNGTTARCGGWGHLLGDEGSGYIVSQRAMKVLIDHDDNLQRSELDITFLRGIVYNHFGIKSTLELLPHMYSHFKKSFIAQLAKKIAEGAREGDALCQSLFREIGVDLAKHVKAVSKSVSKDLLQIEGGLPIVCVGSLFFSWQLMRDGFVETLGDAVPEYTCVQPIVSAAIGAAYHASTIMGSKIPVNFSQNSKVLYHHSRIGSNGEL